MGGDHFDAADPEPGPRQHAARLWIVSERKLHFHEGAELLRQCFAAGPVPPRLRLSSKLQLTLRHGVQLLLQLLHTMRLSLRRSLQEAQLPFGLRELGFAL